MMVGHLAEKAAEAVGANACSRRSPATTTTSARCGATVLRGERHDHQGENRHEKLSPSMSARIIQAHVKDGVEDGRATTWRCRSCAGSWSTRHQRDPLLLREAKEVADPRRRPGRGHDYRYPGPKPQTREAGS
jgi:membrane-associated HD superfamily phosphohydrolase